MVELVGISTQFIGIVTAHEEKWWCFVHKPHWSMYSYTVTLYPPWKQQLPSGKLHMYIYIYIYIYITDYNCGKSPSLTVNLTISMAIFNSYVKLPNCIGPSYEIYWLRTCDMTLDRWMVMFITSGKLTYLWKITMFHGRSTISMVMFDSYVSHYQRVTRLWQRSTEIPIFVNKL